MKKFLKLASVALALVFMGTGLALAQVTDSDQITVTANNTGIFTFTIADASFNFGDVDADSGTASSTGVPAAATGGGDGAVYTALGASTWTVVSSPRRAVNIYNDIGGSFTGPAGGDERLEMQLQITSSVGGSGSSLGWVTFTGTGATDGLLAESMEAGSGTNSATGDLDLRLTILDVDPLGSYQWIVELTAVGTL